MQHSKGFKGGIRPRSVPQPVAGIPVPRPAPKIAFAELPVREHDNSANRAHKSLVKGLENRDKESLVEEIASLRRELLETREAATRVKQEKQRRERDLHLLSKQIEDLKSQQTLAAQAAAKRRSSGGKGHQDADLSDLHSSLVGAAEEEETAEVDEETAQYIGQLQRLKSVLELIRHQQANGVASGVLVEKLRARVQELEAANFRLEEWNATTKVTLEATHRECVQAKQESASLTAKGLAYDQVRAEKALAQETAASERRVRETMEARLREVSSEAARADAAAADAKRRAADLERLLQTKDEELTQIKIQRERALGELVGSSSERLKAAETRAQLADETLKTARDRAKAAEARATEAEARLAALNTEISKEKKVLLDNVRAQEKKLEQQMEALQKRGLGSAQEALMSQREALQRDQDAIQRLGDGHDDVGGDDPTGPFEGQADNAFNAWNEPFNRDVDNWVLGVQNEVARAARDVGELSARVARACAADLRARAGRSARQGALVSAQSGTAKRLQDDVSGLLERLAAAEAAVGCAIQAAAPDLDRAAEESSRLLTETLSGAGSGSRFGSTGLGPEEREEADVVKYYSSAGAEEVLRQVLRAGKVRVLCGVAEFARTIRSELLGCSPGVGNGLLAATRRIATVCTNWELALWQVAPKLGGVLPDPEGTLVATGDPLLPLSEDEVLLAQSNSNAQVACDPEADPGGALSYQAVALDMEELEAVAFRALDSLEEDCRVLVEEVCAGTGTGTGTGTAARAAEETEGIAQLIAAASEWLVQLALTARGLLTSSSNPSRASDHVLEGGQEQALDVLGNTALNESEKLLSVRFVHFERVLALRVSDVGRRVADAAALGGRGDLASSLWAIAQGAVIEMEGAFNLVTSTEEQTSQDPLMGDERLQGVVELGTALGRGGSDMESGPQSIEMFGRLVGPLQLPVY